MDTRLTDINVRGVRIKVPSIEIEDKTVIITGNRIKTASVRGEDWQNYKYLTHPELFLEKIKQSAMPVDIFTFSQKLPFTKPFFGYHSELDNVAAIPLMSFESWFNSVSTHMRKDIKRASKRGVSVKTIVFDDDLVHGIIGIQNSSYIIQGTKNVHYGKEFDTVKRDYSTYIDSSEFIGALYRGELIGIIKIVYVGDLACLMQILSNSNHNDKRPTNALICEAVRICILKNKSYLTYGKYYYGNKRESSLTDFKRRNGFIPIYHPRYYVPLTEIGRMALRMKLHLGLSGILPSSLIPLILKFRSKVYKRRLLKELNDH